MVEERKEYKISTNKEQNAAVAWVEGEKEEKKETEEHKGATE